MDCATGKSITQIFSMGFATVLLSVGVLPAAEYHVDTDAPRQVVFISDAPIESIEGVTESIDGYLILPDDDLTSGMNLVESEFYFEVDLNALDTGIGLRNRHMRENYLHTEKYPYAHYRGTVDSITAVSDSVFLAFTQGELTIHGIARQRAIVDTVTVRNGYYHVATGFSVALPDHEIDIPKLMFLKLAEVAQLHLTFTLRLAENGGQEE